MSVWHLLLEPLFGLRQSISHEGLCRGIRAASYLSRIERRNRDTYRICVSLLSIFGILPCYLIMWRGREDVKQIYNRTY